MSYTKSTPDLDQGVHDGGLVACIIGTRYMSIPFGFVFLGRQTRGFPGAHLVGVAYDKCQSNDAMWWLSIAMAVIVAALHWQITERRVYEAAKPALA